MRVKQFNRFAIHRYLVLASKLPACPPNCLRIWVQQDTFQLYVLGHNTRQKTRQHWPSRSLN